MTRKEMEALVSRLSDKDLRALLAIAGSEDLDRYARQHGNSCTDPRCALCKLDCWEADETNTERLAG